MAIDNFLHSVAKVPPGAKWDAEWYAICLTSQQSPDRVTGVMHVVGSRELRPRLGSYLKRAGRGDEIVVLVHGHPAAIIRAFRPTDAGPLVPSRLLRDELHKAIARARTSSLIVIRYNRVVAVLEAPPESLEFEFWEDAS
jgi:antitoxin (DNA-binding transcriptional repressor) of toxin-antitoxin stability system